MYNILLACDNNYYKKWAVNCIKTIQYFNPWIKIHVVVVNPDNSLEKIKNVEYHFDYRTFNNENSKVAYYQALRFIKVAEIFPKNDLVMTLDCDTVCTRSFSMQEFYSVCNQIHVQRHQKADKWMAGLVTYGNDEIFRQDFKTRLLADPVDSWQYGRDQETLNIMSKDYNFKKLEVGNWMSFGKGKGTFITLKGDQKVKDKYFKNYEEILKKYGTA